MFSSLFGKRRSSPVEDDRPPIPGPKPDDGFVMIDPSGGGGLYPNVGGGGLPTGYIARPAPPAPVPAFRNVDHTFHYLQGVPFQLSKELQLSANKDSYATEISDMLAFLTSKVNLSGYNYNFSNEKSVLKECE